LPNWTQFSEGIVTQGGLFEAFVLKLQFAKELGMMNQEDRPRVGYLGFEHHFEQPRRGFELLGMMPELPRRHFFERHVTGAADLQQRVARDRIKWLDAPVE